MVRACLGVALLVLGPAAAPAYLTYNNGRVDYALWPAHDTRLVVVGEILPPPAPAPGPPRPPGPVVEMFAGWGESDVRVRTVVLGDAGQRGKTLKVPTNFNWPHDLVSRKPGTVCLFVFSPWSGTPDGYHLSTVAPVRADREYPPVKDNLAAQGSSWRNWSRRSAPRRRRPGSG